MKTIITIIAFLLLTCMVKAQTVTNQSGGTTTTTGGSQNLLGDIGNTFADIGLPKSATNYGGGVFFSKSLSHPKQFGVGILAVANVTSNGIVNFVAGLDRLFGGGRTYSANILSGGIMLKQRIYPLRSVLGYFGMNLNTNGWAYNEGSTLYGADLAGKPIGRAQGIGGGIANIVRGGANTDIFQFKNGLYISIAVD